MNRSFFAASLALVFGLLLSASCESALGIDEKRSAPGELCSEMTRCFASRETESCVASVDGRLGKLDESSRAGWLGKFGPCLSDCDSALACKNSELLCVTGPEPCGGDDDCCGYRSGETLCAREASTAGDSGATVCCSRTGVECTSDSDCCPGEGLCEAVQGAGKRCGGVVCAPAGEPCVNDFDCCTDRCGANGLCEEVRCREDGALCELDQDCCDGFCAPGPDGKRCGSTTCVPPGEACDEGQAGQCCEGLRCIDGTCARHDCYPQNGDCSSGGQCCSHYCDLDRNRCGVTACRAEGDTCETSLDCCAGGCVPEGEAKRCRAACQADGLCPNADGTGCCSGVCADGYCVPTCKAPACEGRRVCDAPRWNPALKEAPPSFAPLGPDCFPEGSPEASCMARLCADDPYCCCVGWDEICVARASALAAVEPGCENFGCASTSP